MKILKPFKLNKGDLVGIISPASSPEDLSKIEKGVKYLESLGYRVEVGKNAGQNFGYLAGSDEQRVSDLHYMFGKKEIKAIICVRGGYGSSRLLDKIDYSIIKKHPKIFVGYSDITALQMAFYKKAGLISFAGPMISVDFSDEINGFTEEMFWALITCNKKFGKIRNPDNEKFFILKHGKVHSELLGGNLSMLASLTGTEYFPCFDNKILIIEEINEEPYRIDRMLNQIRLQGIFEKIKGIILGRFVDCYETDQYKKSLSLNEVIDDYFGKIKKPIIYNFKHGHVADNITVAFGIKYKIITEDATIEMTESAVI